MYIVFDGKVGLPLAARLSRSSMRAASLERCHSSIAARAPPLPWQRPTVVSWRFDRKALLRFGRVGPFHRHGDDARRVVSRIRYMNELLA